MARIIYPFFFDRNDYELLRIVNEVLDWGPQARSLHSLLVEHMHPQGIKEMAASRGLRIAYAIAGLLGSFEKGKAADRIMALRSLRDEVFLSATTYYQKNTARVLLQIMKELLRNRGNELKQLKLAHDFRIVSTGNPRKVRAELAKYYLLEMPEEWDQCAFDDHVHDANTKGRKSPTHLIMDAWIKGIRRLTVVYYNYVRTEVVEELIEASAILDVDVQVGIEMSARFREKYVRFTWEPHGFRNNTAFLKFLGEDAVKKLMTAGREVSLYQQKYVYDVLDAFNSRHLSIMNRDLQISLGPLNSKAFLDFVGTGQPSLLHLARFIQNGVLEQFQQQLPDLGQRLLDPAIDSDTKEVLQRRCKRFGSFGIDAIINDFLLPSRNPELHNPARPDDSIEAPALLGLSPRDLLGQLLSLHSSSRFTMNLNNLSVQDTLEILYDCEGLVSHIQAYNLKDAEHGITSGGIVHEEAAGESVDLTRPEQHYSRIRDLQNALNEDNVIALKRVIREIIWDYDQRYPHLERQIDPVPFENDTGNGVSDRLQQVILRKKRLLDILYHLETFHTYYRKRTLGSRVGSGSTGQAEHRYGMGFVVTDTITARARRAAKKEIRNHVRKYIPVTARLTRNIHTRVDKVPVGGRSSFFSRVPFLQMSGRRQWSDWNLDELCVHAEETGNIVTLGGHSKLNGHNFAGNCSSEEEKLENPWKYLNTNLKNSLKVLIGFIPAFLTFCLTKDWWLLAYFGAVIWFGITFSRNIIQSVLGGGGLRRSPLLPWNSLVSWSRIADSLLYTGFSVPLLDYLVKTLLLDKSLGITTTTNPIMLYAVMGLANGIYICSHNIIRGLPRSAAIGNLFRSVLSIPVAVLLNAFIGAMLQVTAVPDVTGELQKWAAVISKFASDCVAAVIEGLADRQVNIRARLTGYRTKIDQLFAVFARLDIQFPEEDVLDILQSPKMMLETLDYEARNEEKLIIVNALDLMYFWMYQPRARKALAMIYHSMSSEEWLIFYRSQLILKRYREISQIFVDGLLGKDFCRALSFYLDRSDEYIADLEKLGRQKRMHAGRISA